MRLLHAGVDISVIALWLGHEAIETAQMYMHADLALKERALRAPHRSARSRGVIGHPTRCSRSWKRFDHVGKSRSSAARSGESTRHST